MANTVTYTGNVITIIPDGTTDYDSSTEFPYGVRLGAIKFYGSAANDVLEVTHGAAAGPIISKMKDVTPSGAKDTFPNGLDCKPYIDVSDCTFNTAANIRIILELL